ncbi:MAG TPA: IPT/TIG domain-containing protein [Bacteroidota bacterium]|nr:IPT/TIG domain-containing protein [Bacteroidota bacterium]
MLSFARVSSILVATLGLFLLGGCNKTDEPSLYNPNVAYAPQPTISGISPSGSAFAAMDTVIVQGTNFSANVAENTVYFNASAATLLNSTATQILVAAPLVPNDSVAVRVAVQGSLQFSNTFLYKLKAGVLSWGSLQSTETSASITTDASGNLLAATALSSIENGIIKVTPAGVRSTYAPATAGVASWTGLKMGPGGYLYSARNFRALYRFSPGGGSAGAVWTAFPVGTLIADIDFDQAGNVWGGGNNTNLFCITQAKVISTVPFTGNVHSVRVFNGYLYFSAKTGSGEQIWRAQISGTSLGTPEVYYDFASVYPSNVPLSITFSSDGILYIGTDAASGLVIVSPSKTASAPYAPYKALFGTGLGYLAWGSADDLYAGTSNGTILKFTVRGKKSATYYGATM